MNTEPPVWLLGYFAARLHAVRQYADRMMFRGVPVTWAMCGVPVVIGTEGSTGPVCSTCTARILRHSAEEIRGW